MGEFFKRYTDAMKKIGRYRAVFVPWTVQSEYQEAGDFIPISEPEEEGALSEMEYQEAYTSFHRRANAVAALENS
jgi:hypothetical protein